MEGGIQGWIHKLEVGSGVGAIKNFVLCLFVVGLAVMFDWREWHSWSRGESMELAQLGRNIAEGKGYTTDYIRPFSLALLERHHGQTAVDLRNPHPDLANAPVYPLLLAGLFKAVPLSEELDTLHVRYVPEMAVTILNQLIFLALIVITYFIARALFDPAVGLLTALLLVGNVLLWEFSISGLPTMLMLLWFALVCLCLVKMDAKAREAVVSTKYLVFMAALAGLFLGLGCLTRYSFGWLVIPVAIFMAVCFPQRRATLPSICVAMFFLVISPWIARNFLVSGTPFGTAGYAVIQNTKPYPAMRLERSYFRSFQGEMRYPSLNEFTRKFVVEGSDLIQNQLPRAFGTWLAALFLVALLLPYKNPTLQRFKYFVLGAAILMLVVQAMGRTHLSADAEGITSENLFVLLTPLVLTFSVAIFFLLLDQLPLPGPQWRTLLVIVFLVFGSLGMIFRMLPPKTLVISFPPYHPHIVQHLSSWMKPEELMMSDMPWAISWYGKRKCMLTTLDTGDKLGGSDFYFINDYKKRVQALYLSPLTLDQQMVSEMIRSPDSAWGRFVLEALMKTNLPSGFPLKHAPTGLLPDHFFLSDQRRWAQ